MRVATAIVALLFSAVARQVTPQELGRLFFTPEQRDALDARRRARLPDAPAIESARTARVDGYVMRSDGKPTIWINSEEHIEGSRPRGLRAFVRSDDPGRVSLSVEGARGASVGVGESLDLGSGKTGRVIENGGITVRR